MISYILTVIFFHFRNLDSSTSEKPDISKQKKQMMVGAKDIVHLVKIFSKVKEILEEEISTNQSYITNHIATSHVILRHQPLINSLASI